MVYFKILSLIILSVIVGFPLFAQQEIDSNYIRRFEKNNVLEIYPGVYSTRFNFSQPKDRQNNYRLVANSSGFVGVYFGYKWLSLKYSWAIPGTELAKKVRLQSRSLGISFGNREWSFRPFYNTYDGLLVPEDPGNREFRVFRDIKFSDAGVDILYILNTTQFSFRAANSFSERQVKSRGSVFIKLTPMWQKVNWELPSRDVITDSTTYDLLAYDPEWFSIISRIGYSYNYVLKNNRWSIAPAILIGGGALKEINTGVDHLQLVTDIQAWIRCGYSISNYYIYFTGRWGHLQTNLFIKNLRQVNTNFSITGGYRFGNLKKKLLRLL